MDVVPVVDAVPLIVVEGNEVVDGNEVAEVDCNASVDVVADETGGKLCVCSPLVAEKGLANKDVITPTVGALYDSWEEIDLHFRCYGKQHGFGVTRTSAGVRQKCGRATDEKRNVTWRCEQWGQYKKKDEYTKGTGEVVRVAKRQTSVGGGGVQIGVAKSKKCECPVMIYASVQKDGQWIIRNVVLEHKNHEPSPGKTRYISMFRQDELNPSIRRRLFNDLEAGISIPQIHRGLARERNGIENFALTQRDMRNVANREKDRKLKLEGGDAMAMYAYLKRMAADNVDFYHSYRLDSIGRLQDVIWVDARSRAAFHEFGDVVCFDATYITNEYELPFANFVGVNHHGQTILLGCALVSHEDAETYEWVFQCWKECMGGVAPKAILTDQDAAMRKAVRAAMPETRHRWCLWHILQKFSKKLSSYAKYDEFSILLQNVIYDSLEPDEFVAGWSEVISNFGLEDDEWLAGLFKERSMWIPCYLKHLFWAGMKTTQRSESINSFFDAYVSKRTKLYEFVQQYFNAMEGRMNVEKEADADCARYTQQLCTTLPVEKTFQRFYTHGKFREFQVECMKTFYVHQISQTEVGQDILEVTLKDRLWIICKTSRKEIPTDRRKNYKVNFNMRTNEAHCNCNMFESHGLLCRHIIAVYDIHSVTEVPEKFILSRWRKDVKRKHTKVKVAYYDPSKTEEVKRYDRMMVSFEPICLDASGCEEEAEIVFDMMRKMKMKIAERRAKAKQSVAADNTVSTPSSVGNLQNAEPATPTSVGMEYPRCLSSSVANASSSGNEVAPPVSSGCETRVPAFVSPGEQESRVGHPLTPLDSSLHHATDAVMKDPPMKKRAHQTREKRYLSCVEKNQKGNKKGKKNMKGGGPNACQVDGETTNMMPPPQLGYHPLNYAPDHRAVQTGPFSLVYPQGNYYTYYNPDGSHMNVNGNMPYAVSGGNFYAFGSIGLAGGPVAGQNMPNAGRELPEWYKRDVLDYFAKKGTTPTKEAEGTTSTDNGCSTSSADDARTSGSCTI